MNEQDIQAFEKAVEGVPFTVMMDFDLQGLWQAALEYARGKQEPVHFRAVLCSEQQNQAIGVTPKVVGFVDKKAAEQFILEKRDFQGWRYNLEPLYTTQPAAEVNAQLLEALKKAEDAITWELGGEPCGLQTALVKVRAAITAAEQQGKGE